MKAKKITTIVLATCLLVTSLTACGDQKGTHATESQQQESSQGSSEGVEESKEEESKEIVFPLEETVEFTVFNVMQNGDYKLAEAEAWQVACERANISFEHTEVPAAEGEEKFSLLVAGDEYPEVVFKGNLSLGTMNDLGSEGVFIPLEDLIREYAPNLTALLDERDAWGDITAPDGHVYTFPMINIAQPTTGWQLWYNDTWRENLGIDEPTSMDGFYDMLKAFADKDADGDGDPNNEIPLEFNTVTTWKAFLQYFTDGMHYVDELLVLKDNELFYYPATDEFKDDFLTLMINMYNDGILDPLSFTQDYAQVRAIGQSQTVYGAFMNAAPGSQCTYEGMLQYVNLKPFDKENFPLSKGVSAGGAGITDKCENPEVFVVFMDYFYTQEGGQLADLGIEGKHYEVNSDGYYKELTTDDGEAFVGHALSGTCSVPILYPDLRYRYQLDDEKLIKMNADRYEVPLEYGVLRPSIKLTEEESKSIADIAVSLDEYVSTYVAQVTIGEKSLENTWEEFQKTLEKMGSEELKGLYQAGYERANAK